MPPSKSSTMAVPWPSTSKSLREYGRRQFSTPSSNANDVPRSSILRSRTLPKSTEMPVATKLLQTANPKQSKPVISASPSFKFLSISTKPPVRQRSPQKPEPQKAPEPPKIMQQPPPPSKQPLSTTFSSASSSGFSSSSPPSTSGESVSGRPSPMTNPPGSPPSSLPLRRFFYDSSQGQPDPMEVEQFKSALDSFIDDISSNSSSLISERPRFCHAVAIVADPTRPGVEIMKATCIKQLDAYHVIVKADQATTVFPVHKTEAVDETITVPKKDIFKDLPSVQRQTNQAPLLEQSIENRSRADSEIEAALKILEESQHYLEDTALKLQFPSERRARRQVGRQ
uniref:Mediator of RNA polymerase II transcription subunit 21 n=1 Tax=Panagrellus redivivus TaxID=6233 RepID=A0A7E4WDJ1_PANRE